MTKMISEEIKNDLIDRKIILPNSIIFIGQGEGHENYRADSFKGKVVIRIKRTDTPKIAGFKNERTQLLFLESQNIIFAPRSVYYDEIKDVHVVSYIDGKDASFLDLNNKQSTQFIDQIVKLESLRYDEYLKFCKIHQYDPNIETLKDQITHNYDNRLKVINNHSDILPAGIDNFLQWCHDKFTIFMTMANILHPTLHYSHGDLHHNNGTSNLRISSDGILKIIDWEDARFVDDIFLDLGNVIASTPDILINSSLVDQLIKSYIHKSYKFTDQKDTIARLRASVWYETVCVPLWMIERYVLSINHDKHRAEDYLTKVKIIQANSELYFNYDYKL